MGASAFSVVALKYHIYLFTVFTSLSTARVILRQVVYGGGTSEY